MAGKRIAQAAGRDLGVIEDQDLVRKVSTSANTGTHTPAVHCVQAKHAVYGRKPKVLISSGSDSYEILKQEIFLLARLKFSSVQFYLSISPHVPDIRRNRNYVSHNTTVNRCAQLLEQKVLRYLVIDYFQNEKPTNLQS